jgi:hypothetical protein
MKVIASILPRELVFETQLSDLSDEDLDEMIARARAQLLTVHAPVMIESKVEDVRTS